MPNAITLHDKTFELLVTHDSLLTAVDDIARKINTDFAEQEVHFVCVLEGAFIFAADLVRRITLPSNISFIKLSSYKGMQSTQQVNTVIGLDGSLAGKNVIIVEDIVDTGNTIEMLINTLQSHKPACIKTAALFFKKQVYTKQYPVDYYGFDSINGFIVGYGLDYDKLGRNLKDVYRARD